LWNFPANLLSVGSGPGFREIWSKQQDDPL
jgi:hypothetical protein